MSRVKVLLVDDVELFLELEKTFFRAREYAVLTARDGVEALRLIRAERPDIVFIDLYLPGLDGDEVCRRVKADPELAATPVVVVTQAGREEDQQRCQAAGCDALLLKPVNRRDFLRTAKSCIRVAERISPRVPLRVPVRFSAVGQSPMRESLVNLSVGGVFIETAHLLPVETPLDLEFSLPDAAEPLRCTGRVAWVNHPEWIKKDQLPAGMGVQFTDIAPEAADRVRRAVRERSPGLGG